MAGEWYEWFLARHSSDDMDAEHARDQVQDAMRQVIGEQRWEENHPDELWEHSEELRRAVRPVLADVGETARVADHRGARRADRSGGLPRGGQTRVGVVAGRATRTDDEGVRRGVIGGTRVAAGATLAAHPS